MSTPIGASGQPRVGTFPLSWSWVFGDPVFQIAAGATITRDPLTIDVLNNIGYVYEETVIGFEESFTISCASAGALGVTLRRQFSVDSLTWFLVQDTALLQNGSTSIISAGSVLRFPAYPFFRYQLINLDGVNVQTLNGVVTLRAR